MAYAAVTDLEARRSPNLPPMTDADKAYAGVLMDDAAAYLNQLLHITDETTVEEPLLSNLKVVSCNMVSRLMASEETDNIKSISQTIGSASGSIHFSRPEASMYLTKADRTLLGISKGHRYTIYPQGAW